MVEIKNIEVFNLERAIRAIENSFNVGEINTTEGSVKENFERVLEATCSRINLMMLILKEFLLPMI